MSESVPANQPKATPTGAYYKLRVRHRRMVDAFVETGSKAEAGRRLNPKSKRPRQLGWRLLRQPLIAQAVREREEEAEHEAGIRRQRILQELARIAFFNPKDLLAPGTGEWLPMHKWPDAAAAAIIGCDVELLHEGSGKDRTVVGRVVKPRAAPKVEALKLLAQIKRLVAERHELTGADGAPLSPPVINIGFAHGGPGEPGSGAESP